jgi:hypothetical protein
MSPHKTTTVVTNPRPQTTAVFARDLAFFRRTNVVAGSTLLSFVNQYQPKVAFRFYCGQRSSLNGARSPSFNDRGRIDFLCHTHPDRTAYGAARRRQTAKPYGSIQMRFGNSRGNALRRQLQHEMQAMKMFAVTPECQEPVYSDSS